MPGSALFAVLYLLNASSFPIDKSVYNQGFAANISVLPGSIAGCVVAGNHPAYDVDHAREARSNVTPARRAPRCASAGRTTVARAVRDALFAPLDLASAQIA